MNQRVRNGLNGRISKREDSMEDMGKMLVTLVVLAVIIGGIVFFMSKRSQENTPDIMAERMKKAAELMEKDAK